MIDRPAFTLGIEEEYLISDAETLSLVREPDERFIEECKVKTSNKTTNEYMQCQLEVGTAPHATVSSASQELADLRGTVAEIAQRFDYSIVAASTHPFATWRDQTHTRKERYDTLREDLGQSARRLLICGMHTHIGIEDNNLRIDLMNQVSYFLPHLLALSCSSPFWEGDDTLLSSYRLTVFDSLPRTGLPDTLNSFAEYECLVSHMVEAGCIEDGSKLWWDIRPSSKFPTIEQRITDVCSLHADAMTITAVYQSLIAYLFRLRSMNQRWRSYPRTLINENRWRAQRYGMGQPLVDHGKTALCPFNELAEEIIELVLEDAAELGCERELVRVREIVARGTSAERQRANFARARNEGQSKEDALRTVTRKLAEEFLLGI
ncbi:MAG: carboxylate-amine ligase [Rhodobacteraceae bacterium]|nr:carboxylate-amine ligase [Paracoccaceae bacterium]MCY4197332.1 carboxylate-amine ligase [Paracoccaceae bacterium]MCY4327622.1 carboxylate-amine ligase [Paracoccaceae bacterium]